MKKLCELQPGEKCCVVGTLFKAMPLQPSILREVSEEVRPAGSHTSSPEQCSHPRGHDGATCLGSRESRLGLCPWGCWLQGHLTDPALEPCWALAS